MLRCTLAELRPLVRSTAGVQRIRFIDDDDLNPWIVTDWGRLYSKFVDGGDPYFECEKELTSDDGSAKLPANFMQLRQVAYKLGEGHYEELPDLDVHEVTAHTSDAGAGRACGYRLRACELQLPWAVAGQTYRITYAPAPVEPKNSAGVYSDTQTMDCVNTHGRDWVVLQSAIRVRDKQQESTASLERRAFAVEREIGIKASRRTATRLKRVAEVVSFDDPFLRGWPRARR